MKTKDNMPGSAKVRLMPVFGKLFDMHRFDLAFLLAAACPVLGYLIWIAINRGDYGSGTSPR